MPMYVWVDVMWIRIPLLYWVLLRTRLPGERRLGGKIRESRRMEIAFRGIFLWPTLLFTLGRYGRWINCSSSSRSKRRRRGLLFLWFHLPR